MATECGYKGLFSGKGFSDLKRGQWEGGGTLGQALLMLGSDPRHLDSPEISLGSGGVAGQECSACLSAVTDTGPSHMAISANWLSQ